MLLESLCWALLLPEQENAPFEDDLEIPLHEEVKTLAHTPISMSLGVPNLEFVCLFVYSFSDFLVNSLQASS